MSSNTSHLETARRRKPNLPMAEFAWLPSTFGVPELEEPPKDLRVRRALWAGHRPHERRIGRAIESLAG